MTSFVSLIDLCIRRRSKSMENANIRPLITPKPLRRSSLRLVCVIISWMAPCVQNCVAIGSEVFAPQIRDFSVLLGWLVFHRFLGTWIRLQPTPLDIFLYKIRQSASIRVWKCLLGVSITLFDILTLKFLPVWRPILTGRFLQSQVSLKWDAPI